MSGFPRFRVHKIERAPLRLIGELSSTQYESETWVQAGWLGDLRVGNRFVRGRWAEAGSSWAFSPENTSALQTIGSVRDFEVFSGYWGERAGLVLDQTLGWREPVWTDPNDHDHCRICWATISSNENTRHFAASPALRACSACYSSYVQPRKIEFSGMGFSGMGGPAA
jgi:hypothetical protein